MNKLFLSILALFISLPYYSFSCSCSVYLNFCESTNRSSTIISAEIIKKYEGSVFTKFMDVEVEEEILGTSQQQLYTIENYGTSCDVSFSQFEIGNSIVIVVDHYDLEEEGVNHPSISLGGCSSNYLTKDEFRVYGNIQEGITSLDYEEFKESIGECTDLSLIDRETDLVVNTTSIYPNPTSSTIQIKSYFLQQFEIEGVLINSSGIEIQTYPDILKSNREIDLTDYPAGMYFLQLRYNDRVVTKKIMKY